MGVKKLCPREKFSNLYQYRRRLLSTIANEKRADTVRKNGKI